MDSAQIVDGFRGLSPASQVEVLVRLAHELTIVARDVCYVAGTLDLHHPQRLRRLNEVQHRITGQVLTLLANDPARYPDEVLAAIILEEQDDAELRRQIAAAFARSLSSQAVA